MSAEGTEFQVVGATLMDQWRGVDIYAADGACNVDFDALAEFSMPVWRADYQGEVRILYDANYYRWLLGGNDWLGVLALNNERRLVGCLFSLKRNISCTQQILPAIYSTAWAVSPAYRHLALGIRLAAVHGELTRSANLASLALGVLHDGHKGMQLASAAQGPRPAEVASFMHRTSIWRRRVSSIFETHDASSDQKLKCCRLTVEGSHVQAAPIECSAPSFQALRALAHSSARVTFDPTESFSRLYLDPNCNRSATLWYETQAGGCCILSYSIHQLALDEFVLGRVGQLQCIHSSGCKSCDLEHVLRNV